MSVYPAVSVLCNEHDVSVGVGGLCSRADRTVRMRRRRPERESVTAMVTVPLDCSLSSMLSRRTETNCPCAPMEDPASAKQKKFLLVPLFLFNPRGIEQCELSERNDIDLKGHTRTKMSQETKWILFAVVPPVITKTTSM